MDQHSLTIMFEEPFWIGLFERIEDGCLSVCKVTFGAEPTDQEVVNFVNNNWHKLKYTKPELVEQKVQVKNPKRLLREAKKQMQNTGIGTKSQQALKLQQEANKLDRKHISKEQREAERKRKFELRQAKHKEKHKGH